MRRSYSPRRSPQARAAHALAMDAKEIVFKAQDAAGAMPDALRYHSKLRKMFQHRLLQARNALEALDRAWLDAGWEDGGHCTCGAFNAAQPHASDCPLYDPVDAPAQAP